MILLLPVPLEQVDKGTMVEMAFIIVRAVAVAVQARRARTRRPAWAATAVRVCSTICVRVPTNGTPAVGVGRGPPAVPADRVWAGMVQAAV